MFAFLSNELKSSVEFSNRVFNETIERNTSFATAVIASGVENNKKLRASKTIGDFAGAQMGFISDVQAQVTTLNSANTEALKELRDVATVLAAKVKASVAK